MEWREAGLRRAHRVRGAVRPPPTVIRWHRRTVRRQLECREGQGAGEAPVLEQECPDQFW